MQGVIIPRNVAVRLHRFTDFFKGFENVAAVKEQFGDRTEQVLEGLKVEFISSRHGYLWIDDTDGHIVVSVDYLRNGDEREIYLDIIHELVHVKQLMEGKELFENQVEYVERATEVEAYGYTVKEAKRLGMTDSEILEYLKAEWMDDDEARKLARHMGIASRAVKAEQDE